MDQQGHYYFQANSDSQSTLLTEGAIDDGTGEICETSQDVTMVDGSEEVCIMLGTEMESNVAIENLLHY